MSGNSLARIIPIRNDVGETNASPLELLLGEMRRTHARVLWLENVVNSLGLGDLFGDTEIIETIDSEDSQMGRVSGGGATAHVRWLLANERQRKATQTRRRLATHPAYQLLMSERKHLLEITTRAISLGIKLDNIELSKRQGEQLLAGMYKFASLNGLDVESDDVKRTMGAALEAVARQQL